MLQQAGLEVTIRPPGVEEAAFEQPDPRERACAIALAKAAATPLADDEVGIAADQVAWDPEAREIFGKPRSSEDHVERLWSLRGRAHHLYTAYRVWNGTRAIDGCEVAEVWIRGDLTREEIEAYVRTGDGSGCAGGYTVEGLGSFLIERIVGDWFSVVGLPLYPVHAALREVRGG